MNGKFTDEKMRRKLRWIAFCAILLNDKAIRILYPTKSQLHFGSQIGNFVTNFKLVFFHFYSLDGI